AKHIGGHLDDPSLRCHDNQAVDQVVIADRIILNKIDLLAEEELPEVEKRLRALNTTAPIIRSSHAEVELGEILGIGAFNLAQTLAVAPDFLEDHEHQHDPTLESGSFTYEGAFERPRFEAYVRE